MSVAPSLTIVTAVYNAAPTIKPAMNSLYAQTLDFEHVVVDGGSTDGTLAILAEFRGKHTHIDSQPDRGLYDALNKGILRASGDIVGILHADDFYPHPQVLERVQSAFKQYDIESCYGDLAYVDRHHPERILRYWQAGEFHPRKFYWGWMPPHPTVFVKRSVYEKHGLFNTELGTAADYELMLRLLLKHRISTHYLPEILMHMRSGGVSNRSLINRLRANVNDRRAWEMNDLHPYPWTTLFKPLSKLNQFVKRPRSGEGVADA